MIDRRFTQTQQSFASDDLETMSEARQYQAHVFELFRPHVGKRVLEIGTGIGTMTRSLLDVADRVVGIEPNQACALRVRAALGAHPRFELRVRHVEQCDPAALASEGFDTVVCSNVLEHIEDDVAALRLFAAVVQRSRGNVLVFVPAVQAVYGPLDAALGHHRRYRKRSLAAAFAAAGLEVRLLKYTNPIGLAAWMYNSWIAKSTSHSARQIRLFESFVAPWALPLERFLPLPIGLSLIAVGSPRRAAGN
jgi:2-polyprenyl-3-methyl-5-hydroxy-6-metoxy-1,4-benzoquinol methylase